MSDLCLFQDLEIGEYFYLPFQGATAEKASATTFDAIGGEWPAAMEGHWIVARMADMTCRRCGCTETSGCHDERMDGPCGWASPGLCSACLSGAEFRAWLDGFELEAGERPAIPILFPA